MSKFRLKRCWYCGVANPYMNHQHTYDAGGVDGRIISWAWYSCNGCGGGVSVEFRRLPERVPTGIDPCDLSGSYIEAIVPLVRQEIPQGLPERAAGYLKEAIECVLQPKACLLSCSSCVDAMLKERGIGGDDLFSRINKAIDTGILTKDMEKWLHHLRLVGNKIRHIENPDPTVGEAKEALEYVTIMAELLYVYPKKLAELKARKEGVVGSKAGDPNSQP